MPRQIDSDPDPEIERLYQARKYVLGQAIWDWLEDGAVRHLQAQVWTEQGEALQLRATVSENNLKISLTCRRTQLIRKWDSHDGHLNPGGEPVDGPHKHYPTRTHPGGEFAYPVVEIPEDAIDDAVLAFLEECNIEPRGGYQRQF